MGSFWIMELSRKIKRMATVIPNKNKEIIEALIVHRNPDNDSFENLSFWASFIKFAHELLRWQVFPYKYILITLIIVAFMKNNLYNNKKNIIFPLSLILAI